MRISHTWVTPGTNRGTQLPRPAYLWRFAVARQLHGNSCQVGSVGEGQEGRTGSSSKHVLLIFRSLVAADLTAQDEKEEKEEKGTGGKRSHHWSFSWDWNHDGVWRAEWLQPCSANPDTLEMRCFHTECGFSFDFNFQTIAVMEPGEITTVSFPLVLLCCCGCFKPDWL